ncbi:DNA-binding protein [Promethearchaeum syntrophicum]|uniref:DNA-binding protein n=1 Tax=Promethearchaeum syntrophicum TaxID=2594042 RepID=A0A5B9DDR6_9ARCH|nr:DNA-binding protein [Candidatus Prometheoarchaeum syntrophicum]QEE17459.1 DNA-binding protein [Candidatus Prometheoarchaeum syntrophicum]
MSDEDLRRLREEKLAEIQKQQAMNEYQQKQQSELESQKKNIMRLILSPEARSRLTNIQMARPQFAQNIELQLIQAFQTGALRGKTPLTDETFKTLLIQLQNQTKKHQSKIQFK